MFSYKHDGPILIMVTGLSAVCNHTIIQSWMAPKVKYTHNTNIVLYLLMAQTKSSPFWYVMIHLLVIKAGRDCFSQIKSFKESQNVILYFANCPYKLDSRDVCTQYLNF